MLAVRPLVTQRTALAAAAATAAAVTAGLSVTLMEEKNRNKFPSVVKYSDISIWEKGNRIIYIQGARNYSQFSADLAARLVQDIKPQGVFVDITQDEVQMDYNIYERVQSVLRSKGTLGEDTDLSQQEMMIEREHEIENGGLEPIPDYAPPGRRFYQIWFDNYEIDIAIKKVFKHLMYAGTYSELVQSARM